LTDHRMTTALLEYYARPIAVVKWNPTSMVHDHYELTTHMQGRDGEDFLLVTAGGDAAARDIGRRFDAVEKVRSIRVPIHRDFELALDVYLMRRFKGYGY